MFNVIVSGGLQNDRQGTIGADRVFEHTSDELTARFKPGGRLDTVGVCNLPTILMTEGMGNEVASIGWLTRVEIQGRECQLQYFLDPQLPRFTNAEIHAMANELRMDNWEFSRNHWAIKDVDLFQVLYRKRIGQQPAPTVFQLSRQPVNERLVSMMMPFAGFAEVHQAVRDTLVAAGYECRRADDFWVHPHIMQDIVELICTSKVVICDLTNKNPNVFYETGITHTLGKQFILITQHAEHVPFDLQALRYIPYLNNAEGRQRLAAEILARVRAIA